MSRSLQDLVRDRCPDVKGTDRLVLLEIAWRADDNGVCWPHAATIAYDANVSLRSVGNAVKTLSEMGILSVETYNGRGNSCVYRLHTEVIDSLKKPPRPVENMHSLQDINSAKSVENMQNVQDNATQNMQILQENMQNTSLNSANIATNSAKSVINSAKSAIKYAQFADRTSQEENKEQYIEPNKGTIHEPSHAQAREALALLGPMATNAGMEYQTFEDFFNAFWSAYNKKVDKAACKLYARSIEPIQWTAVVNGALAYSLSSIATKEGGKWKRNPLNWLEGECWEAYQDGPVIDQPPGLVMNGMQQESAAIRSMVDAASSMFGSVEEITEMYRPKGGVNYAWGEPVRRSSRLDEVRRRGVRQAIDGDFRQVSEGFAFPDP